LSSRQPTEAAGIPKPSFLNSPSKSAVKTYPVSMLLNFPFL
jgi:hypothetical protein